MIHHQTEFVTQLSFQYGKQVYAAAYRVVQNHDDAQDVYQNVFMKLLKVSSHKIPKQPDQCRKYLMVIASRCAIDHLRKRKRWSDHSDINDIQHPISDTQSPHESLHQKKCIYAIMNALRSIKKRDAQVFVLRYFEEMSYNDIGEQMKLSTDQVGSILFRSKQSLKEKMLLELQCTAQEIGLDQFSYTQLSQQVEGEVK